MSICKFKTRGMRVGKGELHNEHKTSVGFFIQNNSKKSIAITQKLCYNQKAVKIHTLGSCLRVP